MTKKRIFYPSFVPVGLVILVGAGLMLASRLSALGYTILVWDGFFNDLMPIYISVVSGIVFLNIVYVSKIARNKYDVVGTIFCNAGCLLVSILTYMSWYAL